MILLSILSAFMKIFGNCLIANYSMNLQILHVLSVFPDYPDFYSTYKRTHPRLPQCVNKMKHTQFDYQETIFFIFFFAMYLGTLFCKK